MSLFEEVKDSFTPLNADSEEQINNADNLLAEENLVQLLNMRERTNNITNSPKPKAKNSSIEICRILAGFFVVNCHLISHGIRGIPNYPRNSLVLLNNISLTCNSLFISISSFFLCDSHFSVTRIFRFWIVTVINLYYAYYLAEKMGLSPFTNNDRFSCWFLFFQVTDIWYSTGHLTFIFIMPLISKLTDRISKRSHFLLVLFLIYTTSIGNTKPNGTRLSLNYNIDLFLVISILMSFYKKYLYEKSILWGFPSLLFLYVSQIKYIRGQWKISLNCHLVVKTFFNGFFHHSVTGTSQILIFYFSHFVPYSCSFLLVLSFDFYRKICLW